MTRNSPIREITNRPRAAIAEFIHDNTPIEAEHLSFLGTAGVLAGATLATMRQEEIQQDPKRAILPLAIIGLSASLDAIDGTLARINAAKNPEKADPTKGMLIDVLNDRTQELGTALLRGVAAHNRGDSVGEIVAFAAAATNSLPSVVRAHAEALGHPVPEIGENALGLMGTRVGRAATSIFATVFPGSKGIPTQTLLDGLTTISNTATAVTRARSIINSSTSEAILSDKEREEGKIRAKALTAVAGVALAATIFTANRLKTTSRNTRE